MEGRSVLASGHVVARGARVAIVAFLVAACGGPASTASPAPTATGSATAAPSTVATDAPPPPSAGSLSVYDLPEGSWSGGMVHLEISGGIELTLDLPLQGGETAAGRTTLTFEHGDPADSRWSLGLVRLSFFFQADSFGVQAGDVAIQGPCTFVFAAVAADAVSGDLRCDDDIQAALAGDPREVTVSGSFTSTR